MQRKSLIKIAIGVTLISLVTAFYLSGGQHYFTLSAIQAEQEKLQGLYLQNKSAFIIGFFITYIAATALSLPIASLLTLLAGAIFGFAAGLLMVSFASSIGATLAFFIARFLFRDSIQNRYGDKLTSINKGLEDEGLFYLFALRLVPVFPFFLVNISMGLTKIQALHFYIVSQIGMLPGTAVYVFAGTALASITTLSDITSPSLLIAFSLLGLLPLAAKKGLTIARRSRHGL